VAKKREVGRGREGKAETEGQTDKIEADEKEGERGI
jgi:hypothetical protein